MRSGAHVEVLGIRHHGPGSARSVLLALDELAPTAVVIEGPPELDTVAALAADPAMVPPVAGLVYDVASPQRASFYPMASFSPEWVAMRWALGRGATLPFAALPAATRDAAALYYLNQLDHHQVARALGVPAGTVKRRLHDARRTLRGLLPL